MARVERTVQRLASEPGATPSAGAALADAARELSRQKLSERMRAAARNAENATRGNADAPKNGADGTPARDEQAGAGRGAGGRAESGHEGTDIARALDRLGQRLGAAGGETEQASRLSRQLSRARDMRDELVAVDRQLAELRRQGEGGEKGQGAGAASQGGRSGQAQSPGRGAAQGAATSGEWEQARALVDELTRDHEAGFGSRDADGFNPGLSAPGTEGWKQDFARWDQLKVQMAAALEKMEGSAASALRRQPSTDRLNPGPSQAVPEQYRDLVDKYFRALASGK